MNVNSEKIPNIADEEINLALRQVKNGKAARMGRVPNEMIRSGDPALLNDIKLLFNKCLHKRRIPEG